MMMMGGSFGWAHRYAGVFLERLFKTVKQTLWLQVRARLPLKPDPTADY